MSLAKRFQYYPVFLQDNPKSRNQMYNKYTVVKTKGWTRAEWLAFRQDGIGGSDAAAIVGENRYKTQLEIYLEKIGEYTKEIDNEAIRAGNKLQKEIIRMYQYWDHNNPNTMTMYSNDDRHKIQQRVKSPNQMLLLKKWPVVRANLDSYIAATKNYPRGILECKFRRKYEADRYTTGVSPSDILQLQHYLLVTGFHFGVIGLLIDGWDYRYSIYKADYDLQEMLLLRYDAFWQRVIQARRIKEDYKISSYYGQHLSEFTSSQLDGIAELQALEPEFTGQEGELELLRKLIKVTAEETVMEGTSEQMEWVLGYKETDKQIKRLTINKDKYQSQLVRSLNGNHRAMFGDTKYFSYKPDIKGIARLYISPKLIPEEEVNETQ